MAKRKYPKLPNGFGSVKRLSGNRTNPFAVYPPVSEYNENGSAITPKALTYVDEWLKGVGVLTAYHNGTYTPGMEIPDYLACKKPAELVQGILAEYNTVKRMKAAEPPKMTFKEVYEDFYKWKFEKDTSKNYSKSAKSSSQAAFKNFSSLHDKVFEDLHHDDLQQAIDACPLKHASLELMVSLMHQMYAYAKIYKIITINESEYLKINKEDDDEHGVPFSNAEMKILWDNQSNVAAEFMLIMCYSGYRIAAYQNLKVDLDERSFTGGVKTRTSKNRTVPIHSGILPLVKRRMERDGELLLCTPSVFRRDYMYPTLEMLGIEKHTPHDCRHTFSRLCEEAEVNENDRKRMMGHSFGNDVTNRVYGHRTIEDLRTEIEKIKICY